MVDTLPYEDSYKKQHVPGAVQFLFPIPNMKEWDSAGNEPTNCIAGLVWKTGAIIIRRYFPEMNAGGWLLPGPFADDPDIIIADEPSGNLNTVTAAGIFEVSKLYVSQQVIHGDK